MIVKITKYADHGSDYLPRTVGGTLADDDGKVWAWEADAGSSSIDVAWFDPVDGRDDDPDRDFGPMADAVVERVGLTLRRVGRALEDAAMTLLEGSLAA